MSMIKFIQREDGSIRHTVIMESGESSSSPSYMAAYCLAKRGLILKDANKYEVDGYFDVEIAQPLDSFTEYAVVTTNGFRDKCQDLAHAQRELGKWDGYTRIESRHVNETEWTTLDSEEPKE